MIRAVLLDLDGTLLDTRLDQFIPQYIRAFAAFMSPWMPAEAFQEALMAGTRAMVANNGSAETNAQVFWRVFNAHSPRSREELTPAVDRFYTEEYPKLARYVRPRPSARPLVQELLARGCKIVLATNPLFPDTAIRQRMGWAGVADLPFDLITTYENMHATKPSPAYYREIAAFLGIPPAVCLMAGDDLAMDGPAVSAGMRFFHVTEEPPFSHERGSLDHFYQLVKEGWLEKW